LIKKKLPPFTKFILPVFMYLQNHNKAIRITGEHYYRVLLQGKRKKKEKKNYLDNKGISNCKTATPG